jgi:hypothetical protein
MRTKLVYCALLAALCPTTLVVAQVQTDNAGNYRLNPTNPNTVPQGPRTFTVGNAYVAGQSLLNVRGDLLTGTNQTPEVFRTNAPTTGLTYWRMFQGGTGALDERGQLFANPANRHFHVNSPNGHFQLLTMNVQRARLNGAFTGPIGPHQLIEFPAINRDGFFLLSGQPEAFTNVNSRAPFTRLHLVDEETGSTNPVVYAQQHGFRPWQRNGITFTGNSDQSYIGHRYAGNDNTDFVIQWSDNPNSSPHGTDRMKFVFTTQYTVGQNRGAASVYGLDALRLWPRDNFEVNVGIGDFYAGNVLTPQVVADPTERLDILNGKLRIRDLPNDPAAVDSFYVMVVDRTVLNPANQQRGVVRWVDPSVLGGSGADCDWTVMNEGVIGPLVPHHVWTAVGVDDECPDEGDRVGIGTMTPTAKLHVQKDVIIAPTDQAALFHNTTDATISIGAEGWADAGTHNIGVKGLAENTDRLFGVWGVARNGGGGAYGVKGEATNSVTPIGVEGVAFGGGVATALQGSANGGSVLNRGLVAVAVGGQAATGVYGFAAGGSGQNHGFMVRLRPISPTATRSIRTEPNGVQPPVHGRCPMSN